MQLLDGTASWFTQGITFQEWKATGSLLWIHGKRMHVSNLDTLHVLIATGRMFNSWIREEYVMVSHSQKFLTSPFKPSISSRIIQEVQDLCDIGFALMAYYCDFMDFNKQGVRRLLASLIAQFSAKSDACYNFLNALHSRYNIGLRQPDDDILLGCLEEMLKTEGQLTIYIIIDALDEYPNDGGVKSPREQVLELVKKLVDLRLANVRICAASCPEEDIRAALAPSASHAISLHNEAGQRKTIADYVSSTVHSDPVMCRWSEEDKEMIIDALSRKADGV